MEPDTTSTRTTGEATVLRVHRTKMPDILADIITVVTK
jgi:hypothetical protein